MDASGRDGRADPTAGGGTYEGGGAGGDWARAGSPSFVLLGAGEGRGSRYPPRSPSAEGRPRAAGVTKGPGASPVRRRRPERQIVPRPTREAGRP